MSRPIDRLVQIGFQPAGCWRLEQSELLFDLGEYHKARNVLYSFVVNDEVKYVGKTTMPLQDRMSAYRYATRSTNLKVSTRIREHLANGEAVQILVLPDNGLLMYGGFHLNLAAGLEDSIIRDLSPPWNGGKKESGDQTLVPTEPSPAE